MKILVFDTETTGLPSPKNVPITRPECWPHIIQFSYIIFDMNEDKLLATENNIIKLSDDVDISPKSIEIHGITREKSKAEGIDIKEALQKFNDNLDQVELIVGHNISFDKQVIMVECQRNNIRHRFIKNNIRKQEYCTMKNSTELCRIAFPDSIQGYSRYKYPNLGELILYLFEKEAKDLHNSMVDVLYCFRAYYKITKNEDVFEVNKEIRNLLNCY
jgi:DNA polymerase III subunit epsilon